MLPEPMQAPPRAPYPAIPPALALDLGPESLAAARLCSSKADANLPVVSDVEPVPARLTPRGSLVALAAMPAEPVQVPGTRMTPQQSALQQAAKVALGHSSGQDANNLLRIRAEAAEQQVRKAHMENKKMEGEIRKLRADAYFQRIGKNIQGPRNVIVEKALESEHAPLAADRSGAPETFVNDAWAARLDAEERAVKAEAENLRLHTELQAARIQFAILTDNGVSVSAPPPESYEFVSASDYKIVPCCRYVCGCFRFFLVKCLLAFCVCCRRTQVKHRKMVDGKKELAVETPVKTFCVVDRA